MASQQNNEDKLSGIGFHKEQPTNRLLQDNSATKMHSNGVDPRLTRQSSIQRMLETITNERNKTKYHTEGLNVSYCLHTL